MDDGRGMSKDVLMEAMRFGTKREYESGDLGKFGLGLKTASISQCRRLTVASRSSNGEPTEIRCWDLDHINQADDWSLLSLSHKDLPDKTIELMETGTGTMVIWQNLDKTMEYNPPDSKYAQNGFARLCDKLEQHLAMVFHRFLSGEAKRKIPLSILLNGNAIEPWDPFARTERDTVQLGYKELPLYLDDGTETAVGIKPYILPHQKRFSSLLAFERASGPNKWNRQQGFYIYREDRMIQSGGWCHLRAQDEHMKLARIAIDFTSGSDSAFRLNVAKTSVLLPSELREKIKSATAEAASMADKRYRSEGGSLLTPRKNQGYSSPTSNGKPRTAGDYPKPAAPGTGTTSQSGNATISAHVIPGYRQSEDQDFPPPASAATSQPRQTGTRAIDLKSHPDNNVAAASTPPSRPDGGEDRKKVLWERISKADRSTLIALLDTVLSDIAMADDPDRLYGMLEGILDNP